MSRMHIVKLQGVDWSLSTRVVYGDVPVEVTATFLLRSLTMFKSDDDAREANRIFVALTNGTRVPPIGQMTQYGVGKLGVRVTFNREFVAFVKIDYDGRRVFDAFAERGGVPQVKVFERGPWNSDISAAASLVRA